MSRSVSAITIYGEGYLPAAVALALGSALRGQQVLVRVLHPCIGGSKEVRLFGAELESFCHLANIDFIELVAESGGEFVLGYRHQDRSGSAIVPFGCYGLQPYSWGLEQGVLASAKLEPSQDLSEFSLSAMAIKAKRFALAPPAQPDLKAALAPGALLEVSRLQQYLIKLCRARGIKMTSCGTSKLSVVTSNEHVVSVDSEEGRVDSDFWLDASADQALFGALSGEPSPPFIKEGRVEGGADSSDRPSMPEVTFAYCDGVAETRFAGGRLVGNPLSYTLRLGGGEGVDLGFALHLSPMRPWVGNCLSVSYAGCLSGQPLLSPLHLAMLAVTSWLDKYPSLDTMGVMCKWHNLAWEPVVKELLAFSWLSLGLDLEKVCRQAESVGGLYGEAALWVQRLVATYRRVGKVLPLESDAVSESHWLWVLNKECGKVEATSVLVDDELRVSAEKARVQISEMVKTMPSYNEFTKKLFG